MRALVAVALCAGCQRPPEVPAGLDNSLRHLFGSFYGSDDEVAVGLTGLLQWYDTEGHTLLGTSATLDNVGAFELGALREDDVEAFVPRPPADPRDASGVIAVAELPCRWAQTEALLVRPDQHVVFTDFDFYERTYVSPRTAFDDARERDAFAPFPSDEVLLVTENATSGTEFGVTIPFRLNMHARHGRFEVDGQTARASLYVTWMPERAEAEGGVNTMEQSLTFEVDLQRDGQTLWVYASWAELHTSLFDSDAPAMKAIAANKAQDTAQRMADICTGIVTLP